MKFAFTTFPRNPIIPSRISIEENVKIDKWAALAKAFYEFPLNQSNLIYKTTRAGATTSLVAESLNRGLEHLSLQKADRQGDPI